MDWGDDPMNVDYGKIYYNRFDILRLACARGWDRDAAEITRFREERRLAAGLRALHGAQAALRHGVLDALAGRGHAAPQSRRAWSTTGRCLTRT